MLPKSILNGLEAFSTFRPIDLGIQQENDALLQQFVVWQYNAYKYELKEYQLNEPLPKIDRERSYI